MILFKETQFFVVCCVFLLSGCTFLGEDQCGQSYEAMYGGYDYVYSDMSVDSNNSINISIQLLTGGGGWLEESEENQEQQSIWVVLYIKMIDGSEISVGTDNSNWTISGDSSEGLYWSEFLNFRSPNGFCDAGCEQVKFSAGFQDGAIFFDGSCNESPWIVIS